MLVPCLLKKAPQFDYFTRGPEFFYRCENVTSMALELITIEWDTFNPDCLIRISNVDTLIFLLNPLFFGYSTEKTKTGLSKLESPCRFCILILNGAQNFKFPGF